MTEQEGLSALRLARSAIESELIRLPLVDTSMLSAVFSTQGAVFVTLKKLPQKTLRGCVGSLLPHRELFLDIIENAKAAAFGDPRFPPLQKEELPHLKIEVSLLTQPKPLEYSSISELLSKIRINIDGLIIKYEGHQATFLPSVWEEIATKEQFLSHLCAKAGLAPDFFTTGKLEVFTYETTKFEEL